VEVDVEREQRGMKEGHSRMKQMMMVMSPLFSLGTQAFYFTIYLVIDT